MRVACLSSVQLTCFPDQHSLTLARHVLLMHARMMIAWLFWLRASCARDAAFGRSRCCEDHAWGWSGGLISFGLLGFHMRRSH